MYKEHAKLVLKQHDYRLTRPREFVLDVLARSSQPLNAYEIAKSVHGKGEKIDVSTVYRILEVYQNLNLVHFLKDAQGYTACYEVSCDNHKHCHHQFVCDGCKCVKELHLEDNDFMEKVKEHFKGLEISNHYFEFSGTCESCLKKRN